MPRLRGMRQGRRSRRSLRLQPMDRVQAPVDRAELAASPSAEAYEEAVSFDEKVGLRSRHRYSTLTEEEQSAWRKTRAPSSSRGPRLSTA